jgi:hypothetical protein
MIRPMVVARMLLGITALLACIWFGIGVRATHDESVVSALLADHSTLSQSQATGAEARLADAGFLNPDESVSTLRAIVQTRAGHVRAAIATALGVVRAHPQDISAWLVLEYLVSGGVDPALHRLAAARSLALAPPVPPAP